MKPLELHGTEPACEKLLSRINTEIALISQALAQGYSTDYASLVTPADSETLNEVKRVAQRIQALHPTMLLLVGIGGSNMGTLALVQALYGVYYHENPACPLKFYCADTIDNDFESALIERMETELKAGGTVILCVVTKSGTTTESIINSALFLDLQKKYRPDTYRSCVVVITDEDSPLYALAQQERFTVLTIAKKVGGRFSVFTAVALFPLELLGIDTLQFCEGALQMRSRCLQHYSMTQGLVNPAAQNSREQGPATRNPATQNPAMQNPAAQSAATLFAHYQAGYTIHNLFVFSPALEMLGNWYKQLIGESLGKKYDREGKVVEVGFTPFVSVGTIDLHSVAQLYLAGPRNLFTTFVMDDEKDTLLIPANEVSRSIPGLAGRSITSVKHAIFRGVVEAFIQERRPCMVITLEKKSSYLLGQFMMMKMFETIFLASLWNINAFDQPEVELYKKLARKLLGD